MLNQNQKKKNNPLPNFATLTSDHQVALPFCSKIALVNADLITQGLLIFSSHTLAVTNDLNLKLCTNLTWY